MCEAVSITLGVLSAGLGIAQSVAGYNAAKEQVAFNNAQALQNFEYQKMQVSSQRAFEDLKESQQQFLMEQNRALAEKAYADEIGLLNMRFMQEEEAAAQQRQQAMKARAQGAGEIQASGRIGLTIDSLIADVYRQQAAYDYATSRNLAFTGTQIQEQKRGSASQMASRINSQQPYIKQPYLDPLRPMLQSKPSATPFILGGAQSVISSGLQAYSLGSDIKANQPGRTRKT